MTLPILAIAQATMLVVETVLDAKEAAGLDPVLAPEEAEAIKRAVVERALARYKGGRDAMRRALDASEGQAP